MTLTPCRSEQPRFRLLVVLTVGMLIGLKPANAGQALAGQSGGDTIPEALPVFQRTIVDARSERQSHKPKVFDQFSRDGDNDLGSLDRDGFKLYRYAEQWKAYAIFPIDNPGNYEDGVSADINGDGWQDIVLGGWGYRTIWAENPAGQGKNPYLTRWKVHVVDAGRFSHEVCAADMNKDGKCDIITTAGIFFQGATPDDWHFVDIGKGGQGTTVGNVLGNRDGYSDVIAVYQRQGTNQIAWFENPGHTGRDPVKDHWPLHVVDAFPGGARSNRDMDELAITFGDLNRDGRPDIIVASMGEGPDANNDSRQIADGLVWYQAPTDPRTGVWVKHVIDATAGWVHASSIQLADFNGDGNLDVCYAEQDQSGPAPNHDPGVGRQDGVPSPRLVVCYNVTGDALTWRKQVLSQYPEAGAGGFNSKVGIIGHDALPSIVTSLHGNWSNANPILLWRNQGLPVKPAGVSHQ